MRLGRGNTAMCIDATYVTKSKNAGGVRMCPGHLRPGHVPRVLGGEQAALCSRWSSLNLVLRSKQRCKIVRAWGMCGRRGIVASLGWATELLMGGWFGHGFGTRHPQEERMRPGGGRSACLDQRRRGALLMRETFLLPAPRRIIVAGGLPFRTCSRGARLAQLRPLAPLLCPRGAA